MTLPEGYRLQRDPDVLVLQADDGRLVAAFSVMGATEESVREVARQDRQDNVLGAQQGAS